MTQGTNNLDTIYCYRHPNRETRLRCNQCDQPICASCAVLTPTGYRCPECIRSQQKVFDTTRPFDHVVAALLASAIAFGGSFVASLLGFFTLLITPLVAFIITEVVRWAVNKRRSKTLHRVTVIATVVGSLPLLLYSLAMILLFGARFNLLALVWQVAYSAIIYSTVHYRLGGTRSRI